MLPVLSVRSPVLAMPLITKVVVKLWPSSVVHVAGTTIWFILGLVGGAAVAVPRAPTMRRMRVKTVVNKACHFLLDIFLCSFRRKANLLTKLLRALGWRTSSIAVE